MQANSCRKRSIKTALKNLVPAEEAIIATEPSEVLAQGKSFSYQEAILTAMAEESDFTAWNFFAVNEHLLLLVPKQYDKLTDTQLGIQRSSLFPLDYNSTTHALLPSNPPFLEKWNKDRAVIQGFPATYITLEQCFIKKEAYVKNLTELSQWIFFFMGHGNYQTIASIPAKDKTDHFSKILNFMETQVITRLLFVKSCHAGGAAFNRKVFESPQGYSFPIIVEGVADEAIWADLERDFIITSPTEFRADFLYQFNKFSSTITTAEPVSYQAFLENIIRDLTTDQFISANYPSLQPAGKRLFFPLFASMTINATTAANRRTPLFVKREWEALKKNKENTAINLPFIIIKSNFVPFEIDLQGFPVSPKSNAICRIIFLKDALNVYIQALRFDNTLADLTMLQQTLAILRGKALKATDTRILIKALYRGAEKTALFTEAIYLEGRICPSECDKEGTLIAYSTAKNGYVKITYSNQKIMEPVTDEVFQKAGADLVKSALAPFSTDVAPKTQHMETTLLQRYKTLQRQQFTAPLTDFARELNLLVAANKQK